MRKLIKVNFERYGKIKYKLNGKDYLVSISNFIFEIIKICKIPYVLSYINEKQVTMYMEEDILISMINNYFYYNKDEKCHYVNIKKLYIENIINIIPFYILNNLLYDKKYKDLLNLINGIRFSGRKIKGPNDLILYKEKSDYFCYIHESDIHLLEEEYKIDKKSHNENDKMLLYKQSEYILHNTFLMDYVKNFGKDYTHSRVKEKFEKYCFLNDIPFYYNKVTTLFNVEKFHHLYFLKFLKKDRYDALDIKNIEDRKLFKYGIKKHFEKNNDCYVRLNFILEELMDLKNKTEVMTIRKKINEILFYNQNLLKKSIFKESGRSIWLIHKDDIYLIELLIFNKGLLNKKKNPKY